MLRNNGEAFPGLQIAAKGEAGDKDAWCRRRGVSHLLGAVLFHQHRERHLYSHEQGILSGSVLILAFKHVCLSTAIIF